MKLRCLPALAFVVSLVLVAACSDQSPGGAPAAPGTRLLSQGAAVQPASAYETVVQQIYVAYFGRAADAGGLAYFETLLANAGAPTTVVGLANAYATNAGVRSVVDIFGTSQESQDLYAGDNTAFITAVYANLFNRAPDAAGLAYWANAIDKGLLTRANAAISIMAGSQGSDMTTIGAKTTVARNFTQALDTSAKAAAYSGLAVNVSVRTMLGYVGGSTDTAAFQSTVSATVARIVAAPQVVVVNGEANGDVGADAAHAGSVAVGGAVTGTLSNSEDVDWYGVDLVAGTIYNFSAQGAGGKFAPTIWVRNRAGTLIANSNVPAKQSDTAHLTMTASATERYYIVLQPFGYTAGGYQLNVDVTGTVATAPPTDIYWLQVGVQGSEHVGPGVTTKLATMLTAGQTYTFSAIPSTGSITFTFLDASGKAASGTGNPLTFTPTTTGFYTLSAPTLGNFQYLATFNSAVGTSVDTPAAGTPIRPSIGWTVQVTPAIYTYGLEVCPIWGVAPSSCVQLGGPVLQDQSPNDSISTSGSADGLTWSPSSPVTQAQLNDVVARLNASLDKAWAATPKPTFSQIAAVLNAAVNNAKSASDLSTLADKGFGVGTGNPGPDVPGALPAQCPTTKTPFDPVWMQSHESYWAAADAHAAYLTCLKTGYNVGNCKAYYDQETLFCKYAAQACIVTAKPADCPG